jgi:DNA-binding MarR family transcriptional regulator
MSTLDLSSKSVLEGGPLPERKLERLFLNVHRLSNALNESGVLTMHRLGVGEWAVLGAVSEGDTVQLKDVVKQSGVSRQRIRKILQELELRGLVRITPVQKGDKRQRMVAGTDQGRALRSAILVDILRLLPAIAGETADESRLLRQVSSASRLCVRIERALAMTRKRPALRKIV